MGSEGHGLGGLASAGALGGHAVGLVLFAGALDRRGFRSSLLTALSRAGSSFSSTDLRVSRSFVSSAARSAATRRPAIEYSFSPADFASSS